MNKLQTLKGFRDFLPTDAITRKRVIEKITKVFEQFGYDPLETPALEYAETLMGKYGDDADKLLYIFEDRGGRKVGLRYDQTVPLARIAAQYVDLVKPFKRYQIQPVWRAENTQKGRYREFLQCDADIIGDSSPQTADAEILALLWNIYSEIGFKNIRIKVNSRQLLKSLIQSGNDKEFFSVVRSLDKLDKIGEEGVRSELQYKQIPEAKIQNIFEKIKTWHSEQTSLPNEYTVLAESIQMAESFGVPTGVITFDPVLARGLDYYTGIIFEVVIEGISGSLAGGGRYDNLINQFVGKPIPAVGFAVGFDRTLEAAKQLNLLPKEPTNTKVLVTYKDNRTDVFPKALEVTTELRKAGINTELFLDLIKDLDKQLKFANKKGIPYVVIIGEEEVKVAKYKFKDMRSGEQKELTVQEIIDSV